MLSVEEAQSRIIAAARTMPVEQVGLANALGRVLAEDVSARRTQPPMAVSAMDGYAVRAADVVETPADLTIVGYAPAGGAFDGTVMPNQAVRIFTGAPVPDGADTIIIQEDTDATDETVTVKQTAPEGSYVRPAGLDFSAGDILLKAGSVLTARDVGLAAAMNRPWLMVRRRPRVAILATGDEVVMPGDPIGPNQIVSSNALALGASITVFGGDPIQLGIAPDDPDTLGQMIEGAAGADLLLTTGGASVGDHDLVQDVLAKHGLALDFWRIAMRPGKPLMFGTLGDTLMIGLPGNPVSTLVCAIVFVEPAIRAMLALDAGPPPVTTARLGEPLEKNDRRQDYLRATAARDENGGLIVTAFRRQDSSMMAPLAHADCLIVRPPFAPALAVGDPVDVILMPNGA